MTALLAIAGTALVLIACASPTPWTALGTPGALLLVAAIVRHHDHHARAARARANRRKGYIR